jgi:hypothetical protein
MVDAARNARFVAIEPHPSSHKLSRQPARSRADIAAIFGQWYTLPEWLDTFRPVGTGADDAAAEGLTY